MHDIIAEEPEEHPEESIQPPAPPSKESSWFWLHEAPFEPLEDNNITQDDISLEFRRVKSLREEQETKIAMFLR